MALALGGVVILWLCLSAWSSWRLGRARETFAATVDGAELGAPPRGSSSAAEQDAIRWLLEGTAAITIGGDEGERLTDVVHRDPGAWSPEDRELVATLSRREAEALALLERAAALHGGSASGVIDEEQLLENGVPLLRGTMLLLGRAGLALGDGPTDAGRTLSALAGVARILQADSGPLQQIFGTTVEASFLRGVRWMVEDPAVPASVLADLLDGLPTTPAADRIRAIVAHTGATVADGDPPPTVWGRLGEASWLVNFARVAEAGREPGALLTMAGSAGAPSDADLAVPNLVEAALKMQAVDAARSLARVALGFRLQATIAGDAFDGRAWIDRRLQGIEPDPFAGGRPEVTTSEDGGVLIANPTAAAAWNERWGELAGRAAPPPYTWRLAPRLF